MTIGFFVDVSVADHQGGEYTYSQSVIGALAERARTGGADAVVILHEGGAVDRIPHELKSVDIERFKRPMTFLRRVANKLNRLCGLRVASDLRSDALDRAMHFLGVDVLVVTKITKFDVILKPYVYVVWDLGHRTIPQFPEVTQNGQYELRESVHGTMIRNAAIVVVGNTQGAQEIRDAYGVSDDRIACVDFFTPEFVHSVKGLAPRDAALQDAVTKNRFVFYPAQFWEHKNHGVIVDALKLLSVEHGENVHAVFSGKDHGALNGLRKKVETAGLADRVHFPGFLPLDEIVWLYEHAVALVYPSYLGPNNLPPYEAMALGCPVLVSDIPGHRVQCAGKAIFFRPDAPAQLASSIPQVMQAKGSFEPMTAAAKGFARANRVERYVRELCCVAGDAVCTAKAGVRAARSGPTFSVITVNLNDATGLHRTIKSVATQTCGDHEHIVIDGGSTDGSVEVIRQSSDSIAYWVSERDAGIYHAMNKGIRAAKGRYLVMLNAGDVFFDETVLARVVAGGLGEDIVYGDVLWERDERGIARYPDHVDADFFLRGSLGHQGAFVKSSAYQKFGGYDERYRIISDWAFFFKTICFDGASAGHIPLVVARCNTDGISCRRESVLPIIKERRHFIKRYFPSALKGFDLENDWAARRIFLPRAIVSAIKHQVAAVFFGGARSKGRTIALLSPNEAAVSETFIRAHREKLAGKIEYYFGGFFPTRHEKDGRLCVGALHLCFRLLKKLGFSVLSADEEMLARSFKKHRVTAVLAEYGPTGAAVLNVCKKMRLPLLVHFHGFDASDASVLKMYAQRYREMFAYARTVFVVSRLMERTLVDALGADAEKVMYNPYGPKECFFDLVKSEPVGSAVRFVAVGRFVEKKAPQHTLAAFKKVLGAYPDATLDLAGDGPLFAECAALVKTLGLSASVRLLGAVSHEEVMRSFSAADVFVQHSVTASDGDAEGTPVAVLEASAAGLAVVSTKHAGIVDAVVHGKTGYLVEEHDVDGMAEYMKTFCRERALAATMGAAGREFVKEHFSMKRHLATIDARIAEALAAKGVDDVR